MTDADRPLNNDWVLGPEPMDQARPRCLFCGALTKLIGRKLFCRDCGYAEGCCDGGKEAIREGELREGEC